MDGGAAGTRASGQITIFLPGVIAVCQTRPHEVRDMPAHTARVTQRYMDGASSGMVLCRLRPDFSQPTTCCAGCVSTGLPMRLRIFLVEDSPVIRANLAESLEELVGARVVGGASSEDEARQWLADNPSAWDLAVVDLFLLQGNGLNVVKSCGNRDLRQKIVVLTGYATPAMRQRCLAAGADAVFDKATEIDEFTRYAIDEVERVTGETRW